MFPRKHAGKWLAAVEEAFATVEGPFNVPNGYLHIWPAAGPSLPQTQTDLAIDNDVSEEAWRGSGSPQWKKRLPR